MKGKWKKDTGEEKKTNKEYRDSLLVKREIENENEGERGRQDRVRERQYRLSRLTACYFSS